MLLKKYLLMFALALFACSLAKAQTKISPNPSPAPTTNLSLSFEYEGQCGNPLHESMLWTQVEGRVTKIISGDTFIMKLKDKGQKRVKLVAVDAPDLAQPFGKDAFNQLTNFALNKNVQVLVNPSNENSKSIVGVVWVGVKDVNHAMIESGLARYTEPPSYSVSNYTACVYQIVEGEARKAKRGLWQNVSP